MTVVAMISNPYRITYCLAYVNRLGPGQTILTTEPEAFLSEALDAETTVIGVNPPRQLVSRAKQTQTRLTRKAMTSLRAGSKLGASVERAIKSLAWRMRSVKRTALLLRRGQKGSVGPEDIRSSASYTQLVDLRNEGRLDELVVFDLMDLPVALLFAEDHGVAVLVR